jgi:2-C-methyl-D-erythritol 4-phosphate cytidylyltransferase
MSGLFRRKAPGARSEKKTRPKCAVVVAAGGASARMGRDKLFLTLGGAPVLIHSLRVFDAAEDVCEIVVAVRPEDVLHVSGLISRYGITKAVKVVAGGATRPESVHNGVMAVSRGVEYIAVHDGARPFVTEKLLSDALDAAIRHNAATAAVPVVATVKRAEGGVVRETLSRDGLYEIQTPQVFQAELLKAALTKALAEKAPVTDDCMAVEALGCPVAITPGSRLNIKLTTEDDLPLAEAIAAMRGGAVCESATDTTYTA